jgi:hypothetical protein
MVTEGGFEAAWRELVGSKVKYKLATKKELRKKKEKKEF